ncbi:MAG: complex I NDUFA9 subunit family protein [Bacillota bacterium]|nr:complex I NDUFA9 subunit family protein [Bacillota bacterium]
MILITGATGFVGTHVLRELRDRGETVAALVRATQKAGAPARLGAAVREGDVTDPVSLKVACQGVDRVVHLVAIIRERGKATFQAVNVEGTRHLAEAAAQAGVRHFVHLSALGAGPDPRLRYTYSKWLGEEAVRSSGVPWTIIRPSVIFGEGFGFVDRLVQAVNMTPGLVAVPGSGRTLFQPVWAGDVARVVARVLAEGAPHFGQAYEIGGPEHLSYEQMLDIVMRSLGVRKRKVHVPLFLVRPALAVMERVLPDPPATTTELAQLAKDNITAPDSIERAFGFRPRSFTADPMLGSKGAGG